MLLPTPGLKISVAFLSPCFKIINGVPTKINYSLLFDQAVINFSLFFKLNFYLAAGLEALCPLFIAMDKNNSISMNFLYLASYGRTRSLLNTDGS